MKKAPQPSKVRGAYGEQLSFLPPQPFCPRWPRHTTISGRVLAELLRGEWLAHMDVIEGCSSWRLAAYFEKLKKMGWPVVVFERHAPSANCPSRCIAIYSLSPEVITQTQSLRGAA